MDFLYCLVCLREILLHKKNQNMEEIQGGHCPCSKIQGGQPTTLPPPCRAPVVIDTFLYIFWMMRPLSNTSRRMSQICSIELRSGDLAGQFITPIPSSSRKVMDTLVVLACALSCISRSLGPARFLVLHKNVGCNKMSRF